MKIFDAETLNELNPVLATKAHQAVSTKYAFASTEGLLSVFANAGWHPVTQSALAVRKPDRKGFQKHMVILENDAYPVMPGLEEDHASRPQLLVVNSHDKASAVRIMWGMIRFACLNGIVAGDALSEVRLTHNAKLPERLPAALEQILAAFPTMVEQAQKLSQATLSAGAVQKLIKTAYDARLEGAEKVLSVDYSLPCLRRYEDQGQDAFTIFNRVQETVIRGGISYVYARKSKDSAGNVIETPAHGQTRAIKAIDQSVKLNQLVYSTVLELV